MSHRRLWIWTLSILTGVSALLALLAVHFRSVRAADRRLMKTVYADECERVRMVRDTLKLATQMNEDALLARARAFRHLLKIEPEMLKSAEGRFDECRRLLGLDELHVSDAKGKLICSIPKSSLGFDLNSIEQSRFFMPAITNRAFEFVQEPIVKKLTDGRAMQYAGVSRPDAVGVIQVGQRAEYLRELQRMTSTSYLSSSKRVGKQGLLLLEPLADEDTHLPPPEMRLERIRGRLTYVYEGDSAGMRLRIEMPLKGPRFLPPGIGWFFGGLGAVAFVLLLMLLRGTSAAQSAATQRRSVSPVTVLLIIVFLCAALLSWTMESASARRNAEAQLVAAVEDVLSTEDSFWKFVRDERFRANERLDQVTNEMMSDLFYPMLATGWHVGNSGYFVCYRKETGEILSCGSPNFRKGDTVTGIGFDVERDSVSGSRVFVTTLYGENCLCAANHLDYTDARIVSVLPMRLIQGERNRAVAFTVTVVGIVILFLAVFMNRLSRTASSLRERIADDKARRAKDLELALTIRRSVMPTEFPKSPNFTLTATLPPDSQEEMDGDFYDCFRVTSGRLLLMVGQVNATGIAAAMEMMKTKSFVKSFAASCNSLVELVERTNAELCAVNDAQITVSVLFALYDETSGRLESVNAGYPDSTLGGECCSALGQSANSSYAMNTHQLHSGDELTLGGALNNQNNQLMLSCIHTGQNNNSQ